MAGRWEAGPFPKRELEEVRRMEGNSRCVDCWGHDTDWGGVSFGILLCMRCAGRHRSLGTHISVIKSVSMDRWDAKQVHALLLGGNGQLQGWFDRCQVGDSVLETKYVTNAATIYRQKLAEAIAAGAQPAEASDEPQGPIAAAAAEALRKESRRAERAAAKERRAAVSHGNGRHSVGGSAGGSGSGRGGHGTNGGGGGGEWGGNARVAAPRPRRAQPGLEGQAAMAGAAAGGASYPAAASLVRRLGNGEYEATFYDGSMGFTLVRDASGRALVTKIAPGGQAYGLGVRVGDFLVGLAGDRVYEYDEIMMRIPGVRRPMGLLFEGAGGIPPAGAAVAAAATAAAASRRREQQQAVPLDRRREARPAEHRSGSSRGDAGRSQRRKIRQRSPSPVAAEAALSESSSDAPSASSSNNSSYKSSSGSERNSAPENGGGTSAANGKGREQRPAAVAAAKSSAADAGAAVAAAAAAASAATAASAAEANGFEAGAAASSSKAASNLPLPERADGSDETGDGGSDGGGGVAQILKRQEGTALGTQSGAAVADDAAAGADDAVAGADAAAAASPIAVQLAIPAAENGNDAAATVRPAGAVMDEESPSSGGLNEAAAADASAAAGIAPAVEGSPQEAAAGNSAVPSEAAFDDVAATTEVPPTAGVREAPPAAPRKGHGEDGSEVAPAAAAAAFSDVPSQREPLESSPPDETSSSAFAAPGEPAIEAESADVAAETDCAPDQAAIAAAGAQQNDDGLSRPSAAAAATMAPALAAAEASSADATEAAATSRESSQPEREPTPAAAMAMVATAALAAGTKVVVQQSRGSRWRKAVLGRRHGDGSWKVKYSDGLEEKHVDAARIRPRESSGGLGGSGSSRRSGGGGDGGGSGGRERAPLAAPPPAIREAWAAERSEGGREVLERYAPHGAAQLDDGFFASDGYDSDGMQERMRNRSDRNRLEAQSRRQAASAAAAAAASAAAAAAAAQGTSTWPGADGSAAAAGSGGGQEFDATFGPGPLGLTLTKDVSGGGVVTRVAAGGAAEAQGVRAGDRLTRFGGRPAASFEQVMAMVRTSARPLKLSFRPRMVGIGGGGSSGSGGTLAAPAVTWADVGIGAAIGVMDAANTVAVGLGLGRPTSPIQQTMRALPPGSVGFAPPPLGGRAYLGPAAGAAGGASAAGFIAVPTAIAGGYGNSIRQYRTVTVDVPTVGPAMSTRQALEDAPAAAAGEMDVVFEEGKLGMRLEERGAHRVISVVTRVDPEGQARDQGVVEGSVVLGVNGERFLSHAHTIATLMHGRRPVALRLRVGVPDDAYR